MAGLYDRITFGEKSGLRKKQAALTGLRKGEDVLDVGCGTGALTVLVKMAVGEKGNVCGVDIAPGMIAVAQKKAGKYGLHLNFRIASVTKLPFPDASFDVVTSSLMFHHLPVPVKREGLREIHRVLRESGRFFLTDFCTPGILSAPLMFLLLVWMKSTRYQFFGKLPGLIRESGFERLNLVKKGTFFKTYMIMK